MEFEKWLNYLINVTCFTEDAFISLSNGKTLPIADVKKGMQVMSHDGTMNEVMKTSKKPYFGDMYTFKYRPSFLGNTIEATAEHPFLVAVNKELAKDMTRGKEVELKWVPAKDVKVGQYFVTPRPKLEEGSIHTVDILDYLADKDNILYDDKHVWFKKSPVKYNVSMKKVDELADVKYSTLISSRCAISGTKLSKETQERVDKTIEDLQVDERIRKVPRFITVDEKFARLLGLYAAKGYKIPNGFSLALGTPDVERGVLEYALEFLKGLGFNPKVKTWEKTEQVIVEVYSKIYGEALENIAGKGAHNKHVPPFIFNSPPSVKKEFIRGYIEGDGCIPMDLGNRGEKGKKNTTVTTSTASQQLATELAHLLKEFGILPSITITEPKVNNIRGKDVYNGKQYRIVFGGVYVRDVFPEWIGDAKFSNQNYLRDDSYFYYSVSDIEKKTVHGDVDVYNLQVDNKHSFIANGLAVHNCSIFSIDPAEINFPNRGGATGHAGNTLNESSTKEKTRDSKDKGLEPLLKFIEDAINKYIVSQFGDKYVFNFVGGDTKTELDIVEVLAKKAAIGLTINDIRAELGYPPVKGGDVTLAGVHVQRLGQLLQEEQMKQQRQMEMNQFVAQQTGYNGDLDNVNGKGTYNKQVGKDGQLKGENNTNSTPQGGKGENGDPINDWEI